MYVLPAFMYGAFLIVDSPALERLRQAYFMWGRRLLGWPGRSPRVGVLGELGWLDLDALGLLDGARFLARLIGAPSQCCLASRLCHACLDLTGSCTNLIVGRLRALGIPCWARWRWWFSLG